MSSFFTAGIQHARAAEADRAPITKMGVLIDNGRSCRRVPYRRFSGKTRSMRPVIFFFVMASSVVACGAQDFPTSALTPYPEFRRAMLKYGWKPDESYGDKMYGFPEVICGAHMCTARWNARNGKSLLLTLWQDDAEELRVAPQTDRE
jgi:hypothetical protein